MGSDSIMKNCKGRKIIKNCPMVFNHWSFAQLSWLVANNQAPETNDKGRSMPFSFAVRSRFILARNLYRLYS